MKIEMIAPEKVILREIADGHSRDSVALTYAHCIVSSDEIDWQRVNAEILSRWSPAGLRYIKDHAWRSLNQYT